MVGYLVAPSMINILSFNSTGKRVLCCTDSKWLGHPSHLEFKRPVASQTTVTTLFLFCLHSRHLHVWAFNKVCSYLELVYLHLVFIGYLSAITIINLASYLTL